MTGRISQLSLLKADTMMCRSISGLSMLVSMQFSPNYLITMTTHIVLNLSKSPDADILKTIIVKLQKRVEKWK